MFTLPKAFSRGPEESLGGVEHLAVLECVVLLFPQPALPPVGRLLLEGVALLNDFFPLESKGSVPSERGHSRHGCVLGMLLGKQLTGRS